MLGLRDVVVLTPSPSSLHHHQHQQPTNHHPNIPLPSSAASLGVGVGIFPFLTAGPAEDCGDAAGSGGNFWRTVRINQESRKDAAAEEKIGGGASSLRACEDCGNRAKRDCSFRRCRTCCKSRGYDCSTHLKSTWVPAAVRRERHVTVAIGGTGGGGGCSTGSSSGANKRPRMAVSPQNATSASHTSTSNNAAATRTFPTATYHQDASFKERLPGQVIAPAVFRCIKVTAINDEEAELGYQATATISGHVFKGFLYDQGVDEKNAFPCISEMHLHNSGRARNGASSSSPIVDPSSGGAFASSGGRGLMLKGDS